jgi:hypothetical protein
LGREDLGIEQQRSSLSLIRIRARKGGEEDAYLQYPPPPCQKCAEVLKTLYTVKKEYWTSLFKKYADWQKILYTVTKLV